MNESLYNLYMKNEWSLKEFYKITDRLYRMMKCPCLVTRECIHDILPKDEDVGQNFCTTQCPASKIWQKFQSAFIGLKDIYIYGNI